MSFHALLGAFPIATSLDSLDPQPNARVGELRASSRGGALGTCLGELMDALPGHEALRFLAGQKGPLEQRQTDPQTLWTVLDTPASQLVLTALGSLLAACDRHAESLAARVAFGSDRLDAAGIRQALLVARDSSDPNAAVASGEDGDTAEFVFAVLVSLRELLRRAQAQRTPVAVFTWAAA